MIRRIETTNRGFGSRQVPYFQIRKNNLPPILKALALTKDIIMKSFSQKV
jgi:hypothetical protein